MAKPLSAAFTRRAALVLLTLGGCTTPTPPPPDLPQAPAAFKANDARAANTTLGAAPHSGGEWWKVFGDARLDELIALATRGNTSVQAASARLAKARAALRAAHANRMPQVNANGGVNYQGGPLINAAGASGTLWTVSAGASYEPDLFGRLAKELNAATLDAASREALLASARLVVQADVAQHYFSLRALDAERAVVRDTLAAHRETLRVAERRFELGSVAELDVARLRAELAAAQADAAALERRRAELEHALALLTGEIASNFQLDEAPLGSAPPVIPPGIPSSVLARRPDVAAAQRAMLAAQARLSVAQSAWLPSLALTTSHGYASTHLADLIAVASRAWAVGALLSLPIFDGGRREAAIRGANADLDAAVVSYREQIITVFKDVEDQLSALRLLADQSRAQAQAVAASQRASTLAHSRYVSGVASQLDLLDAQRSELRHRRQALQVHALQYQATIGLIRALGGGWDAARNDDAAVIEAPVTAGAIREPDANTNAAVNAVANAASPTAGR